ncbi:GpE family phage tail protein [Pseudoduganella sp. FT55W]|uniref:GpE family phage tail protein n=1 Tax=Duganella rivi TaxID=2666083 RepID=A0A7X4GVR0_9BURK|nr:GpE family phage tail protein [Duganella rivi]MYM70545.1 GpE family phage tail protein [Duganella rivi]
MADIAVVFHWTPQAMDGMSLAELMDWREQARIRSGNE